MRQLRSDIGFSLIELMVSVAIIGILATIAIPSYQSFVDKARYRRAGAEMASMATMLEGDRVTEEMTFVQLIAATGVSGYGCGLCVQGFATGIDVITATNAAPSVMAGWKILGYDSIPYDPWGRPYGYDENEGEFGSTDCRYDEIFSAGLNHILDTGITGMPPIGGDDAAFIIPPYSTTCLATGEQTGYDGW